MLALLNECSLLGGFDGGCGYEGLERCDSTENQLGFVRKNFSFSRVRVYLVITLHVKSNYKKIKLRLHLEHHLISGTLG